MCLKCAFLIPPLHVLKFDEFPVDFSVLSFGDVCVYVCVCARTCAYTQSLIWVSLQPHGPPGSSVHGIFQARVLEWVSIFYSRGSS